VHLNQDESFDQILSHKKLIKLSDNYFFYKNNRKFTRCKILQKGNHYIQFRTSFKVGTEDRIVVLMSAVMFLKEIPVPIPTKKEFFEKRIKSEVEDQIFGSFDIEKIMCAQVSRFISYDYEGFFEKV
jgi:hypothetical protein